MKRPSFLFLLRRSVAPSVLSYASTFIALAGMGLDTVMAAPAYGLVLALLAPLPLSIFLALFFEARASRTLAAIRLGATDKSWDSVSCALRSLSDEHHELSSRRKESDERQRLLLKILDMVSSCVLLVSERENGKLFVEYVNSRVSNLFPEIHFASPLPDGFPSPASSALLLHAVAEARASGKDSLFDADVSGSSYLIRVVRLDEGTPARFLLAFTDDSRIKSFEEQLFEQLQFGHDLIQNAPSALAVREKDGAFISVNAAWCELFETEREFWLSDGASTIERIFSNDAHLFVRPAPLAPGKIDEREVKALLPSSRTAHLLLSRAGFGGKTDESTFYVESYVDVSFAKAAEERMLLAIRAAEENSQLKSAFLANMSHEIRTPMNSIIGMTRLVLDSELQSRQREFLQIAHSSAESLLTIINDILDFSKIEAGKLDIENIEFDPRQVVSDACKTLYPKFTQKNVQLLLDFDASLPCKVLGDPGRLRQLLLNLISNALKFTEQGHVRVEASAAKEANGYRFSIKVEDTGCGISPDKLSSIFDAFSQADSSATRKFGGTGLGLAISRNLAQLMGGDIRGTSELGVGSVFFVSLFLPRTEEDGTCERPPSFSGQSALVFEPNPFERETLCSILESWNMAVFGFRGVDPEELPYDAPFCIILGSSTLTRGISELLVEKYPSARYLVTLSGIENAETLKEIDALSAVSALKPLAPSELFALLDKKNAPPVAPVSHQNEASLDGLRIIVAEDNPVNQRLAAAILAKFGCSSTIVPDGQSFLDVFFSRPDDFDVVLMDVQMPGLSGLETVKILRSREIEIGRHPVPVVALTAHAMEKDRQECLRAGMNAHVTKPIRFEELRGTLDWLSRGFSRPAPPSFTDVSYKTFKWEPKSALHIALDDKALLRQMSEIFVGELPDQIASLRRAFDDGDAFAMKSALHSVKGALLTLGHTSLAEVCVEMEKTNRIKQTIDSPETLISHMRHFSKELSLWIEKNDD